MGKKPSFAEGTSRYMHRRLQQKGRHYFRKKEKETSWAAQGKSLGEAVTSDSDHTISFIPSYLRCHEK